jgi:O-acetyl-ADP-ribose deacetylase (regulator of RNase III)
MTSGFLAIKRSLAFPAISCGVYGYPIDAAVEIACRETIAALKGNQSIEKVIFACFGENVYAAYVRQLKQVTD